MRAPPVRVAPQLNFDKDCERPNYPPAAAFAEVTGVSRFKVTVGIDGRATKTEINRPSGPTREHKLLDRAVEAAIKNSCKFKPGTIDGRPQPLTMYVEYDWHPAFALAEDWTGPVLAQNAPAPPAWPVKVINKDCAPPDYPLAAARAEATGVTRIKVTVGIDGRATETEIVQPAGTTREHGLLDRAAELAVRTCHFKPGDVDGNPQPLTTHVEYRWILR
jgi:TonB family protein